MFIKEGKWPFSYPWWVNVSLKIALVFTGRKDRLIPSRTTLWNLFSKSKGAPLILVPPPPTPSLIPTAELTSIFEVGCFSHWL